MYDYAIDIFPRSVFNKVHMNYIKYHSLLGIMPK